ncbi:DMT family transporter [Chloroflexota bacterium]
MEIFWGLSAALSFGLADFASRFSSRKEGPLKTLLYLQLFGIPVALLIAALGGGINWNNINSFAGILGILVCFELTFGNFLLYRALALGPVIIVSPITSSSAAITLVLSLLSGEKLQLIQAFGVGATLIGVIVAAIPYEHTVHGMVAGANYGIADRKTSGIPSAVGAAILFGFGIWLLRFVVPIVGSQTIPLLYRVSSLSLLLVIFGAFRRNPKLESNSSIKWLLAIGFLDTIAFWFLSIGLTTGLTSIVSVITSLYSIVTMVLGYLFLGERLAGTQKAGIALTLTGVALVSL